MVGRKLRSFTLIELLVVIMVVMILATFVSINLISTRKRARDNKRIADVNNIAAALDQYAIDNSRRYPLPSPLPGSCSSETAYINPPYVLSEANILKGALSTYLSPLPTDPANNPTDYNYFYYVRCDGQRAAVFAKQLETGDTMANIKTGMAPYPEAVTKFLEAGNTAVYYVSK